MSILLLGDIVIDRTYYGISTRIAPEGPFPIVNVRKKKDSLGCMGNVLNNIKDFFNKIYLVTSINKKDHLILETYIKECNSYKNVIHINIPQLDRSLIIKNRVCSNNQYICRFDQEEIINLNKITESTILEYIISIIDELDIILFSDYSKGFLTDHLLKTVIK